MSQLYPNHYHSGLPSTNHRCQIDCSNHDQVISSLQLKSKDLYYFWRNYEWLYTRYYALLNQPVQVPVKESHEQCNNTIDLLQSENDRLLKENKHLKLELETLRRKDDGGRMELDYKKQISLWQNKANEYQQINQKLLAENNRLKKSLQTAEDNYQSQRLKLVMDNKKARQTIVELQQIIDELRSRSAVQPVKVQSQGVSNAQLEQYSRRQLSIVAERMRILTGEVERTIAMEFDGLKGDIDARLMDMLSQLSQQELQSVIVVEERYER